MIRSLSPGHPALIITALALAQLTIGLDYNIVFVALPDIAHVGFSAHHLQLVISAYAVTFGGFLLFGGRLADLVGRRRVFLVGLTLYALASALGGLALNPAMLVAARAIQGVGGALLAPATLSLVATTFAEGARRNRALSVWGASGSTGMVLGSLLGGLLTQAWGWPAVFFVNVPLAAGIALLGRRVIPTDPAVERGSSFDVPGTITATGGALLLVFSLVQGPVLGWTSPVTVVSFGAAAALWCGFVVIEARGADPLVPPRILTHRNLGLGSAITFMFMATFGASAYFLTVALQTVRGWDALATGLAFILPCAFVLIGTIVGGKLATAVGVRAALIAGLIAGAVGMAGFAWSLASDTTFLQMSPAVGVFSFGQGIVWTAMFAVATSGVGNEFQGLASGIATSGQQIGGAVGLAVLVAVANTSAGISPGPARLSHGLQTAMSTAAVLVALTLGLAFALRKPSPSAAVTDAGAARRRCAAGGSVRRGRPGRRGAGSPP